MQHRRRRRFLNVPPTSLYRNSLRFGRYVDNYNHNWHNHHQLPILNPWIAPNDLFSVGSQGNRGKGVGMLALVKVVPTWDDNMSNETMGERK